MVRVARTLTGWAVAVPVALDDGMYERPYQPTHSTCRWRRIPLSTPGMTAWEAEGLAEKYLKALKEERK